jgi:predicted transcriptional regulator
MLPPRVRRLLSVISGTPGMTLDKLAEESEESLEAARENLEVLIQLGYVIRMQKNGDNFYKAALG